jgi:hypothetical protein
LEEEEGLLLTPFERNLEVWRQLWRVLERSDIVVQVRPCLLTGLHLAQAGNCVYRQLGSGSRQLEGSVSAATHADHRRHFHSAATLLAVLPDRAHHAVPCCAVCWQVVDARDPVTYFSQDLVEYALELHPTKRSFVLLNKADLLPAAVREAWADYFDARGVQYGFWSAFAASEAQARARHDASAQGLAGYTTEDVNAHFWELLGVSKQQQVADSGSRTRILPVEELLEVLEVMARQAVNDAEDDDSRRYVCVSRHVGCSGVLGLQHASMVSVFSVSPCCAYTHGGHPCAVRCASQQGSAC